RDPDPFGLRAAQPAAERAGAQVPEVLAQGGLPAPAEPAMAAHDVEGQHDPVAGGEPFDVGADRLHHPDRLVADRLAGGQRGLAAVEVEVRTADRRGGDAHDRVVSVLDHRVGDVADPDLLHAFVDDGLHPRTDRSNYCSSTNCVGTSPARFTSTLAAFMYRTIVGRSPFSLSLPCIIPLTGSSSFLMTSFH